MRECFSSVVAGGRVAVEPHQSRAHARTEPETAQRGARFVSSEVTYGSLLLPGQLQTPDYAAALLEGNLRVPPMEASQVVRARMARQRLASDGRPLRFRAVIEEYALDRLVGGPQVMCAQLEHLLELMRRDNVELHVMPVDVAVHDGLDGDFLLLDFEEAQSIGYIEYPTGAIYVQDQDVLAAYNLSVDRLCAAALSVSDSADAVATRIKALDMPLGGPR